MGYDVDMRPLSNEIRTLRVLHARSSQARETRPLTSMQNGVEPAASQSRPGPYDNNWEGQPLAGTRAESMNTRRASGELYHPLTAPVSPAKETGYARASTDAINTEL